MVLGGYAVIHYGYARATDDLDIWIALSDTNSVKVSQTLKSFGGFSDATVRPSKFLKKNLVFVFGREPLRVDILTGVSGVDFEACYARRREVDWDGISIPLISLEDLKTNKLASGRNKDLADVDALSAKSPKRKKRKQNRKRHRR